MVLLFWVCLMFKQGYACTYVDTYNGNICEYNQTLLYYKYPWLESRNSADLNWILINNLT